MPSFAAAQQMPVQRQLLELGVTQHSAAQQYLPPAPPSLPEAFQLLYDYQPTPFHEHSTYGDQGSTNVPVSQQPPPDDPLVTVGDIEDILQNLSKGDVPAQSHQSVPQPVRTIMILTSLATSEEIDFSIEEHFKRSLSRDVVTPPERSHTSTSAVRHRLPGFRRPNRHPNRRPKQAATITSTRTSTSASADTVSPPSKKRALSESSSVCESESGIIPAALPPAAAANVTQPQSDNSVANQRLEPIDEWPKEWILSNDDRVYRFKCGFEGCGKTYKRTGHLCKHLFSHRPITKYQCPYPECADNIKDRYHRDPSDLKRHIGTRHTRERPYPCRFCALRFLRKDHANSHMKTVHEKQYEQWLKKQR